MSYRTVRCTIGCSPIGFSTIGFPIGFPIVKLIGKPIGMPIKTYRNTYTVNTVTQTKSFVFAFCWIEALSVSLGHCTDMGSRGGA